MTALDEQVGGRHYKNMPIQPIEFIMKNNLGFPEGCIIKYICRHPFKGGILDLQKAKQNIDFMIEHYYPQESTNKHNKYCENCTDINEGVFVIKAECKCEKPDKFEQKTLKKMAKQFHESPEKEKSDCLDDCPETGMHEIICNKQEMTGKHKESCAPFSFKCDEITDIERLDFFEKYGF